MLHRGGGLLHQLLSLQLHRRRLTRLLWPLPATLLPFLGDDDMHPLPPLCISLQRLRWLLLWLRPLLNLHRLRLMRL